ncbi:MAG: thioredoxin family protein [Pseudomonadota bacterium]
MKIQVLGTGCMKCNKLYDDVNKALGQAGVSADVQKVEKIEEIMKFGVAFTPALVIDGEVKSAGKVPSVSEIVTWITSAPAKE